MAILWMVLRGIGIVLLLILTLVALLLFLPARVEINYNNDLLSVHAAMLFVRVKLYPRPEKTESKEVARKEGKKSEKAGEKSKNTEKAKQHSLNLTVETVLAVIQAAGGVMKRFFAALHFRAIRIYLPVRGKDAADTAISYGRTSAWAYSVQAAAHHFLDLQFEEFRIEPDFAAVDGEKGEKAHFSCKITSQLYIMLITVVYTIIRLKNTGIV